MARNLPTDEDRVEALRRVLGGLVAGEDVFALAMSVADLHPARDTFPGEVFMALGADALEVSGVTAANPVRYEDLITRFLPECDFKGRTNRKVAYGVLTAAARRGGVEPDLFDDAAWWQTDDYWRYALFGAVALVRACDHHSDMSVAVLVEQLAQHYGISLEEHQ